MSIILLPEWIEYLNYPGLEIWKFADLAIFLTAAIIILKKPINQALASRREAIRAQLQQAQEERDTAAQQLAEAEALLARLDDDVEAVRRQALEEAKLERERQAAGAANEIQRLKTQADRELEIVHKTARKELQEFLATRSIELAKQSILNQLGTEDDLQLVRERVNELRRAAG